MLSLYTPINGVDGWDESLDDAHVLLFIFLHYKQLALPAFVP